MMKKLSEKLRQYLSLKTDGTLWTSDVSDPNYGKSINQVFSSTRIGVPPSGNRPLKVASSMIENPSPPIIVYWIQKMVYYREGLNALQIYSAFQNWLDKPNSMDLSTADGPYVSDYENVPDMIIRTMEFKVGPHDIIQMTVTRVKKDWEFIEVTKEMLAGMQEDLS